MEKPEKMEEERPKAAAAEKGVEDGVDSRGGRAAEGEEVKIADVSFKSPYLDYDNLDDYKMKGYGAEGHQDPKPGRGAGATDAPTPSGGASSVSTDTSPTSAINRQGVP